MAKYFRCKTDKPALSYRCGEPIVFTVTAHDHCMEMGFQYVEWKVSGDDGQQKSGRGSCAPGRPLVIETVLTRPGFVHLECTAYMRQGNAMEPDFDKLDAGAGAEIEKIQYCDTIPADYDAFWADAVRKIQEFPLTVVSRERLTEGVHPEFDCWAIELAMPFGCPVTGLLAVPKADGVYPTVVKFHGYGISTSTVWDHMSFEPGRIELDINAHGLPVNIPTFEAYARFAELKNYGFDEAENADPKGCYWYGMILRDLMAMRFAKTVEKWDAKHLTAYGGSQGAFQATNVAAHDPDVTLLEIRIPWFANLNGENCGYMAGWRPKFAEGLRYFDTAAAASRVTCPVKITAYLGDYVCPPSTQMALYANFHCAKAMDMIQSGTHSYRPPEIESYAFRDAPDYPNGVVRPGRYRHYKGGEYRVLSVGTDSETGQPAAVYQAADGSGKLWVRPAAMFSEPVETADGIALRFAYLGE